MKKKKALSEAEVNKLREITAYDHHDKKRSNNPAIGMAKYDRVREEMAHYAFDL